MKLKTKIILYTLLGAIFGYSYYHFFGCTSGCAIKSTWYISTIYGSIVGFALAIPIKSKAQKG